MKLLLAVAFISILLMSIVAPLHFFGLAEANPNAPPEPPPNVLQIHIRADGSIDPSTVPIRRVNNTYVFFEDILNGTIKVERNNTVIDGNGFILQGITLSSFSGV